MKKIIKLFVIFLFQLIIIGSSSTIVTALSRQVVRVGFFEWNSYHNIEKNEDGTITNMSGYGYDYLHEMAKYTDWSFVYVEDTFEECLKKLEKGEIDILTSVSKTPEREKVFSYSDEAIGKKSIILTTNINNKQYNYNEFTDFNNIKIGLIKGNSRNNIFEEYAKKNNFTYQSFWYNSLEETEIALKNNEIEGILTSNLRNINNYEKVIAEFESEDYYVVVKKGNDDLLTQINDSIDRINIETPLFIYQLNDKYYGLNYQNTKKVYTQEEKKYLADKKSLKILIAPNLKPLFYYQDGNYHGIINEIMEKISIELGISFEYIYCLNHDDYLKIKDQGDYDFIGMLFDQIYSAEKFNIKLTKSYLPVTFSYLSLKTSDKSEYKIATLKNSTFTNEFVKDRYDEKEIYYCNSYEECYQAVKKGIAETTVLNSLTTENIVYSDFTQSFKSTNAYGVSWNICCGVKNNEEHQYLYSALNKAIHNVDQVTLNEIIERNTINSNNKISLIEYIYLYPVQFFIVLIITICIIVIIIILLIRKRHNDVEKVLLNESARFSIIIGSSYTEIAEVNLNDKTVYFYQFNNDKLLKIQKGLDLNIIIDNAKKGKVHPEDLKLYINYFNEDNLQTLIDNHETRFFECRLLNEDGSYHWFNYLLQGMIKDSDHINNFMVYKNDINSTKKEEQAQKEQLISALRVAEQASLAKGEFTSRMSHEIRTPLNAIIGFLIIARNNITNPDRVIDCLNKVEFSSKHLLSLINDVLDISTIEAGKLQIASCEINIKQFMLGVTSMFYAQATTAGIDFETNISGITEEYLISDELRLNQILFNILSNAIKFTKKGKVSLTVNQMAITNGIAHYKFIIEDTGIGMTDEFIKKIGKPFNQQDAEIAQKYGGTGLGLSITKNLINILNGKLEVESTLNVGSKFTIDLPLKISEKNTKITINNQEFNFSNIKVLIVEDDDIEYQNISNIFINFDIKEGRANSINNAISILEKPNDYNLILLCGHFIHNEKITNINKICTIIPKNTPVVVATSYDSEKYENSLKKNGVTLIIKKPIFSSNIYNMLIQIYGVNVVLSETPEKSDNYLGYRILLAEDNQLNAEIATEILKEVGFEVIVANNGKIAYNKFIESNPGYYDIILMDIQMPIIDGYEATKKIRKSNHPDAVSIPIVAMTANAFMEDISQAFNVGMNNHISKPIDISKMMKIIDDLLNKK